jgi:hypothetical protein
VTDLAPLLLVPASCGPRQQRVRHQPLLRLVRVRQLRPWTLGSWRDYYCKRAILCLSSSKILAPHSPLRPVSVSSPPPHQRRRGGWGVIILEDERHRIALFTVIISLRLGSLDTSFHSVGKPVLWIRIRTRIPDRFGCPGSGSVLGMRIQVRIQRHWNLSKLTKK